ncbi:hypothetical protein HDU91_007169 [Kappamyces sp. JEL0680]|nr:hypothetical protein HDU91_007169 [Kappamyces sp. JEL0680]
MLLVENGADYGDILPLMLRYAASVGHSKLLNFFIALSTPDPDLFYSPSFSTEYELEAAKADAILELLKHSMESGKVICAYLCLKTDILKIVSTREWKRCLNAMLWGASVSIGHLLLEKHSRLTVMQACAAVRGASFAFFRKSTKQSLRAITREMVRSLDTSSILDDQAIVATVACESGREDLILDLYERGVTFDHFDGAPLFSAMLFGYHKAVKVLLNVCNANTAIFHSGRTVVILLLSFDHVALLYALLTSFLSVINEVVCRIVSNEGPNIVMFSWTSTTRWCIPDTDVTVPYSSLFILLFFAAAYMLLTLFCQFFPLLYCIFLVKRKIERSKRTVPALGDIENQDSATTIVVPEEP